ncbi:redoxin family protein [Flavihumibacter sp. UBA7668]|uniref:redoxin family protein n=1 Tax=Flavihumibacter sp. UBA7668 TaxID=1946542 RepID=UPI0025C1FB97|nr:redoxin family protein [Flavihumibacter sp. UBA7668]
MRKICMAIFFLSYSISLIAQQASYSRLQVQPEAPQAEQSVELIYQPELTEWKKAGNIPASVYIAIGNRIEAKDLSFKKNKTNWSANFTIPDSAALFVVKIGSGKQVDNNDKKGYSFFVMDKSGEPIKYSYRLMSQLYRGQGWAMGISEDEKKADFYFNKYYENGLPSDAGYEETLTYYQIKKDTTGLINYFADLPNKKGITDQDFASATFYANQYQHKPVGSLLSAYHKLKFPDGVWKPRELYPRFNSAKTAAEKQAVLDSFKATIKGAPQEWQSRVINNIYSNIANLHAMEGNLSMAEKISEENKKGTDLASSFNSIAWQSAEKGKHLAEAAGISKKSLDILEKEKKELAQKPLELSTADYLKQIEQMEGMFADTYAYILYQLGKYKEGFPYMQRSLDIVGTGSSDYNEHYSQLLEKVKGPKKTIEFLEKTVVESAYSGAMKEQLEKLYKATGKKQDFNSYFEGLTKQMKERRLKELKEKMLNEAAPEFALKDLNGNEVSLATLKGKVVVIDFWATWCGPCIASFPAMYAAQQNYKDQTDVVFLFVNTWEQAADKKKNVEEFFIGKPYSFPIQALDTQDKMVGSFKVDGIPTKFVLDKNGKIRFKSVGYSGNESKAVDEISAMVSLASEASNSTN